MKILITGANGQLGSEIKALTKQFPDWQFLYTDIDELNITNENEVKDFFQQQKPDFVINCAAYTAAVSYTHLRAHETKLDLVCRLLLEKKKNQRRTPLFALKQTLMRDSYGTVQTERHSDG